MNGQCRSCVYWNSVFDYCGCTHQYHVSEGGDAEESCHHYEKKEVGE